MAVAVPSDVAKSTVMVCSDGEAKVTTMSLDTPVSSAIVLSAIDKVGAKSSSAIVNSPTPSFTVTLFGLLKVIVTVSSTSSKASARTEIGIFFVVSPGANVSVPDAAV